MINLFAAPIKSYVNYKKLIFLFILSCLFLSCTALKLNNSVESTDREIIPVKSYFFGWPDFSTEDLPVRGGTTTGVPVVLDTLASPLWKDLQSPDLSGLAKDQAAIRALSGEFKVSFDFMETMLFGNSRIPSTPYRSWGTEKIYVLNDEPGLIELQHILVMSFFDENNEIQGPFVMKHWRQKWQANPDKIHEYIGNRTWVNNSLQKPSVSDLWIQTVYQVDDSPRYALKGKWTHYPSHSEWSSEPGDRPLPRREYSYRNDYETLFGSNRITVHPTGWIHEQDNLKKSITEQEQKADFNPTFLAREIGLNRYTRIRQYDFTKGDEYLEKTRKYWKMVRDEWAKRISIHSMIQIRSECNGSPAYQRFFELAASYKDSKTPGTTNFQKQISEAIACLTATE